MINMTSHRVKFITSPNLSSLEREINNWLKKEERNINIRQMNLYTDINDDYEMTFMIWYEVANKYTVKGKHNGTGKGLEELAKISSART